jgi:hypothetical protein
MIRHILVHRPSNKVYLSQFFNYATASGTQAFLKASGIGLYHHFLRSDLYINPIIHGPPKVINTYNFSILENL